jgi:hypothetical protein
MSFFPKDFFVFPQCPNPSESRGVLAVAAYLLDLLVSTTLRAFQLDYCTSRVESSRV